VNKKSPVFICALLFFVIVLFGDSCFGKNLSSIEIKKIEDGIAKIKEQARGPQRAGYMELKVIGADAVPFLIEILNDKNVNRESRRMTCLLLGELKAREAVNMLIYTLKNDSYTVREAACKALGEIKDSKAAEPLMGMLQDIEAKVRAQALYSLINFSDKRISLEAVKFLKDNNQEVRLAAATVLNEKISKDTSEALRTALEKDSYYQVRATCAQALGKIKDINALDVLIWSVKEDKDATVRAACATSLGQLNDKKAIPALIEALSDEYKDVQLNTSRSLAGLTGKNFGKDYQAWIEWYKSQNK